MDKPLKIISEIKTPRLTARAATTAMTDGLFHAIDISRNRLREFLFWVDNVQKVEDERKTLSDFAEGWEKGEIFAYVLYNTDEKIVGTIDVHNISYGNHFAELGYWLKDGETGKGYISEILPYVEKIFFAAGLHRLVIECETDNIASAAVANATAMFLKALPQERYSVTADTATVRFMQKFQGTKILQKKLHTH